MNLDVAKHSALLCIGKLSPVSAIEASHEVEDVVADHTVTDAADKEHSWESLHQASDVELGSEHVSCTNSTNVGSNHEPEGVPAGQVVLDSKLFSISEQLDVLFDVVSSFQTEMQAELLLSLKKAIDIFERSWLLATEWESHVVPGRHS